jgi:hypothetical protein
VPAADAPLDHDDPGFAVPPQPVRRDAAGRAAAEAAGQDVVPNLGAPTAPGGPGQGEPELPRARTARPGRRRTVGPRIVRRRRP